MNNTEISQRRLQNQGLSKIIFRNAQDVVTQLGAVQAQDYAGAKWALAQRLEDEIDGSLDKEFNNASILRTHLMRPTWHFVAPGDIRWMLMLTAPRVHAASSYMYRQLELNKAIIKKSYKVLEKTLQGGKQLTRTELAAVFEKAGIVAAGLRMGYFMMSAELDGVICSGARKGKQFTYALLEERVPPVKALTRDEALAKLVKRYFKTRGPATVQDFAWWSGLTMADAKIGIDMVKSEYVHEVIDGQTYWFPDSISPKIKHSPIIHLLPNYDEYFIGFKDRNAIGNRIGEFHLGDASVALYVHIIFVDGQIVGGWRRTIKKNEVLVELSLLTKLTKAEKQAITTAFQRYSQFLGAPVKLV